MRYKNFVSTFVAVMMIAALGHAQQTAKPDLVPVEKKTLYCAIDDQGNLVVIVKNQGNAKSKATKTRVAFGSTIKIQDTPALGAGETVRLKFKLPAGGCCNPDCTFTITVDVNDQNNESNEKNNKVNGHCLC